MKIGARDVQPRWHGKPLPWKWIGLGIVILLALVGFVSAAGYEVDPILVPLVILAVVGIGFAAATTPDGRADDPWDLNGSGRVIPPARDRRIDYFVQLADGVRNPSAANAAHDHLVALIDDRLLRHHGIDRHTEPQRAAATLGPTLTRFVTMPPTEATLANRRGLADLTTAIESI